MRFKVGDIVVEEKGWHRSAKVVEARRDENSATGEWYLVDFGPDKGNEWTCGEHYSKKISKKSP